MRRSIPERHEGDWAKLDQPGEDLGPTDVELRFIIASIVLMLVVLLMVVFVVNTLNPGQPGQPTATPSTYGFPPAGTLGR